MASFGSDGDAPAALAKINLALHVGAVRADGFHPVDTLCVFVPAGDRLSIRGPADVFSLAISGPRGAGLSADDNLVLRAARAFADTVPGEPPVRFHLHKAVPAASGIGGGTSNGALALHLLNERAGRPIAPPMLLALATELGADGPICLAPLVLPGSCFRGRGTGTAISPGPTLPPLFLVLTNPGVAVPTGPVFRAFDASPAPTPFSLPPAPTLPTPSRVAQWAGTLRNDLTAPAIELAPVIAPLIAAMRHRPGCLQARMSGSGATVFGLFASATAAARARRHFAGQGLWAVAGAVHGTGARMTGEA